MLSFGNRIWYRVMIYGLAVLITAGSLLYSNYIVRELANQERKRVELYAKALKQIGTSDEDNCSIFLFDNVVLENEIIPTVIIDKQQNITNYRNIPNTEEGASDEEEKARDFLNRMIKKGRAPVEFEYTPGNYRFAYYDDSKMLKRLRYFPYLQLLVIAIFIGIVFAGFAISKRNEQNRVWVGLAKETAHQLGTPVSSMMAWVELLKLKVHESQDDYELVQELQKDITRLEVITERFSKIGSKPELHEVELISLVRQSADYMRKRMPAKVALRVEESTTDLRVKVSPPLFAWVLENLLKNALDAIQNDSGEIRIHVSEGAGEVFVDVEDSGKGIPKGKFRQVFKPGYTTKKRGWGLGLSLTKRIIENYHKGRIFVRSSVLNKGTTFRISLPKK